VDTFILFMQFKSDTCVSTLSRYIVVTGTPKSSFTVNNTNFCLGTALNLTNNSTPTANVKYLWLFGNGDTSSAKATAYKYKYAGTYTISLVTSTAACTDTSRKTVTFSTPTGAQWVQGKPFSGYFYTGTSKDPDLICVGDTETYEISPPSAA